MEDRKESGDWFNRHRMLIIGIFLLIIWFSILTFLLFKSDEITKHPCTICAQQHNEEVICRIGTSFIPISRTYSPDGLVMDSDGTRRNN